MKKAILGKKLGMTQVFTGNGVVVPVTVVQAGPCRVIQKKTLQSDGYESLVVAFEEKRRTSGLLPFTLSLNKSFTWL